VEKIKLKDLESVVGLMAFCARAIRAQWPDKYAAQPKFIFPAESVNSSRVSLDRQSLSGKSPNL
jgi:hypothetical protein